MQFYCLWMSFHSSVSQHSAIGHHNTPRSLLITLIIPSLLNGSVCPQPGVKIFFVALIVSSASHCLHCPKLTGTLEKLIIYPSFWNILSFSLSAHWIFTAHRKHSVFIWFHACLLMLTVGSPILLRIRKGISRSILVGGRCIRSLFATGMRAHYAHSKFTTCIHHSSLCSCTE